MGHVIIQSYTDRYPITMIGKQAGICWGADISDDSKNCKRGLDCLESEHGRTFEFPDVYMILDGYSARVVREWYTHIGGAPTRLQASTRYIDYEHGFGYVVPSSILSNQEANDVYTQLMSTIAENLTKLDALGVPREDSALGLPLGMETKIVCKHNLRNLIDMSHQRMCSRAYHEYRTLFQDLCDALSTYSDQWAYLVDHYFQPKCNRDGFCRERHTCGRKPRRDEVLQ
jgi:thymidylate synthase (FAD)